MTLLNRDRLKELSTTIGTGSYELTGALAGFRTFFDGLGVGNSAYYFAVQGDDWEAGIGTLAGAALLERTSVSASSNAGAAVNWPAGSKTVTAGLTAAQADSFASSAALASDIANLAAHIANVANPHAVTKAQVGLGSADDTSDLAKPISTATQAAIDAAIALINAAATGQVFKNACRVRATTGTLATDFDNGKTTNGVTLATNERFFWDPPGASAAKGPYTVNASGSPTRATDADTGAEMVSAVIPVLEGTLNSNTLWIQTVASPITIGVTNLNFTQLPAPGAYAGGLGIVITGNSIAVNKASQAEAEAGLTADKYLDTIRGLQAINALAPLAPFAAYSGGASANIKTRMKNSVSVGIGKDVECDMTGATGNAAAAWNAAYALALAETRQEIIWDSGIPKYEATVAFINKRNTGKSIKCIGRDHTTRFRTDSATRDWHTCGDAANTSTSGGGGDPDERTAGLIFEGFVWESPSLAITAGNIFKTRQSRGDDDNPFEFRECIFSDWFNALSFGVGGASNDQTYVRATNCGYNPGALGNAAFLLGSGSTLTVSGDRRSNGTGRNSSNVTVNSNLRFIKQTAEGGTTGNWDGVFVRGVIAENFTKYVDVTGAGIDNMTWEQGQIDRYVVGFDTSNAPAGSINRNWIIANVEFNFAGAAQTPVAWAKASGAGAMSEVLSVMNCHFRRNSAGPIVGLGAIAHFKNNTFYGSSAGVPLLNYAGKGHIIGNDYVRETVSPSALPSTAVAWSGTGDTVNRVQEANVWGAITPVTTGTR